MKLNASKKTETNEGDKSKKRKGDDDK
jgi:hypothetical protein